MSFTTRSFKWSSALSAAALIVGLTACNSSTTTTSSSPASPQAASPASPAASGSTVSLSGAGATFPDPLYQSWFSAYNKKNPTVQVSYQAVGSGDGVKKFLDKLVDFGATDAPLTEKERAKFPADRGKPVQIPMTGGAVVLAYNLEGVTDLKLSRETYCGIVDGSIKSWDDPKIAKDNAGAKLPKTPITFVHRSDGSGTTFIFTSHLKAACPNWKAGAAKSVEWPTGQGAPKNAGVASLIQQTPGAIGYTELSYVKQSKLTAATLQNKAGKFIVPSPESSAKAFDGAKVPEDFALSVPDPEQADAYPIVSLTWLLLYETYDDPAKAEALKGFIKWALNDGKQYANELGYLPLPADLASRVVATLDTIKVASK